MPEPGLRSDPKRNSPEVELLLSCARSRLSPEVLNRIRASVRRNVDWLVLIRLAMHHDVMPLLYRNLQHACAESIPDYIFKPLAARYQEQTMQAFSRAEELVRILPLLEAAGISALPYKGPTLAQSLYGDLGLREFGDLDIMILEPDVLKATDVIRGQGYQFAFLKNESKLTEYIRVHRELQFCRPDGKMLELHWRFAMREACVKHDPERFLQRFEMIPLAGAQVCSLSLEVYFLTLSLHATKHKWRQLKLICDIAEILGQPDLDWQYVLREAKDLGLERMLSVAVLLAEDPLDVLAPPELAQGLKFDRAARTLAAQICQGLFEKPDENWHREADYKFQSEIRECLHDRARMFFSHWWPRVARRFVPVPDWYAD